MKGPPIRVTEAERDMFLAAFNRQMRYAVWLVVLVMSILCAGLVFLDPHAADTSGLTIMLVVVPCLVIFPLTRWIWGAPARALEGRAAVGEERTRDEIRQIRFAKLTYRRLGAAALLGVAMVLKMSMREDVLHGWGMIWLALGGVLVAVAGAQAIRKWHYERN